MNRPVTIALEREELIGAALEWPLRLAGPAGGAVTLLVLSDSREDGHSAKIDLVREDEADEVERRCAGLLRAALDEYWGEEQWSAEPPLEEEPAGTESAAGAAAASITSVAARLVPRDGLVSELQRLAEAAKPDTIVFVGHHEYRREWRPVFELAQVEATCHTIVVVPRVRESPGGILLAVEDRDQDTTAIVRAHALASGAGRRLTALFVEPDIGDYASAVGRRILDTALCKAEIEPDTVDMRRRVVVSNEPTRAIVETASEPEYEVLISTATVLQARRRRGSVSAFGELLRGDVNATLIVVRRALPLSEDLSRRVRSWVERRVPQLERDDRVELVTRIQSNSDWNFDFVALMGLASLIAAMGLIDDSAAVIIGAMLVAPLMTPLLGFALALVQKNGRLARMTSKSVGLGFTTAIGLAALIGWLSGIEAPTAEMNGRDAPQLIDAVIAFASGIAAAYASARPGLIGALPGVAIAAALVPPIVTAGLAAYLRIPSLAWGALLLFGVNMILIIVAATIALWGVGIRAGKRSPNGMKMTAAALALAASFMAIVMALGPKAIWVDSEVRERVEALLPDGYALRGIAPDPRLGRNGVVIHLAGLRPPGEALVASLIKETTQMLGDAVGTIELTFAYELLPGLPTPSETDR
ncbi:MAG: DUF389 domain-containing protein [Planctomycetota bacterium]